MLQLTLLEKLQKLFDLILTSPFFIFLLIFTILVFIILLDSKSYKRKKVRNYIIGIYTLVFVSVIIKYHSSFFSVLDYLVNSVFVIFYFPNIAVYGLMILIINIIVLMTIFNKKDKVTRVLNMTSYTIIMYLMLLVIHTITKEGLDVYDSVTLYTNQDILILIELSNILFVIWLILLGINKILELLETKGIKTKSRLFKNNKQGIVTEYIEKEVIREVPVEVIKEVPVPVEVERIVHKQRYEDMFTKDEYMLMLQILKGNNKKTRKKKK